MQQKLLTILNSLRWKTYRGSAAPHLHFQHNKVQSVRLSTRLRQGFGGREGWKT